MKATMRTLTLAMAGLALACFWPATTRAQAEVAPDFYALDNAVAIEAAPATAAAFQGNISLPYRVECGGKKIDAGKYMLAVKTDGENKTVVLHRDGQEVSLPVRQVSTGSATGQSAVLVRRGLPTRTLEAVYVQDMNAILYLNPSKKASMWGRMLSADRLPIS